MGWFSKKDQARDISNDLVTLSAIAEGLSKPCPPGRGHLREAMLQEQATLNQRVENGARRLYKYETGDEVTEQLNYYQNCCMCLGKCKGH